MPATYQIRDPQSGRVLTIRGERPPTQTEAAELFARAAPEQPSGPRRLAGGVASGLGDVASMVRHPIDTAKAFGGGLVEAAKAVPDVTRNLLDAKTRGATVRGFGEGALEGASGVSVDEAKRDPWTATGRFLGGVVIPAAVLKGAPKIPRMIRAGRGSGLVVESAGETAARLQTAKPGVATGGAETSRIPYRAPDTPPLRIRGRAKVEGSNAGGRLVSQSERPFAPPPNANVQRAVAEALQEVQQLDAPKPTGSRTPPTVETRATTETPAVPAVPATADLPKSWQQFVEEPKPAGPRTPRADDAPLGLSSDQPIWSRGDAPDSPVRDLRGAVGAEDAGALLGMEADDVRAIAGGPKRRPLVADLADLDRGFARLVADPRGAVDPKLAVKIGVPVAGAATGAALADDNPLAGGLMGALAGVAAANPAKAAKGLQTLRVTGMLSGAALPKSIAGNAGAFATAAAERGSLAPLKEAFRAPTNLRNAARGWSEGANPSGTGGMGAINLPGRAMGALDTMTTEALQRSGLSLEEAQRLLLTKPNPLGNGALQEVMQTPLGRAVMPFQRTPFNGFIEGMKSLNELAPGSGASKTRRALTVGAGAAGAAAGTQTENPLLLALLAAMAGPRGIPFALGAGATAGPKVLERVGIGLPEGSFKDLLDPLRPINKPALLRLLETGGR